MKILIAYFTRTKTTEILAESIGRRSDAVLEQIKDKKEWKGAFGYLRALRSTLKKELTEIEDLQNRIEDFDLVIIGSPVWVGTMPPAVRTFIQDNKNRFKKLAVFTTQGSAKKQRIFSDIEKLSGLNPVAELYCSTKSVRTADFEDEEREFVDKIKTL